MSRAGTPESAHVEERTTRKSVAMSVAFVRAVFAALATGLLLSTQVYAQGVPASCPANLNLANIIEHDFQISFCELCDIGTVRLVIENPYRQQDDADFSDIVISDDLQISGQVGQAGDLQVVADDYV